MVKPPPFDYVKMVLGIISAFSTIVLPIAITWLVKNFKALKKSNEHIDAMKKQLADEAKAQYNRNNEFNNSLQRQINESVNAMNKEIDRKTDLSNYELDRNRKGIDNLCNQIINSADKFDEKVKDSSNRLKSEMMTKAIYYQETSKFKDEFLRDILNAKSGLQNYATPSRPANITNDLLTMNKKIERLSEAFKNDRIADSKKHNLTRKLLGAGLNERRQLEISVNNIKAEIKSNQIKTNYKLDNYNKLLTGLKGKVDKNKE